MNKKYMCPFCVSSWVCDGPHIEEKHVANLIERIWYIKEDVALLASETINQYGDQHGQDMQALAKSVYNKIMNRSIN